MYLRTGWAPYPPHDPWAGEATSSGCSEGEAGLTVTLRSATGNTPAPNLCHKRCDLLLDLCQVSVSTFYLYVCLQLCVAQVKVTCLLFISWEKLLLSLTKGFVHKPEGRGAASPQTLLSKHQRKPHGFTLREKDGGEEEKQAQWWN